MRAQTHVSRVVEYPVERGSRTNVPIQVVVRARKGLAPEAPKVLWPVGFAEGEESAARVADALAAAGFLGVGIRLPFAQVVARASNMANGLDHLIMGALPYVAKKVAPRRPTNYGGNSLGGGAAIVASANGPDCEALGVVSPLASNRMLGRLTVTRQVRVAWRLLVRTRRQNIDMGQEGIPEMTRGFKTDLGEMGFLRFLGASGYTFSNRTEDLVIAGLTARRDGGLPTAVLTPDQDDCFCPGDYQRMFGAIGCAHMLQPAVGPHATMLSEVGIAQVEQAAAWFSEVQAVPA